LLTLALSLLVSDAAATDGLPTADDIHRLAQAAKSVTAEFKASSAELRFQYEFSGRFLDPADKLELRQLATRASRQLHQIAVSQQKLKKAIEQYEGDDWEDRYGSTGLWRRLFTDCYLTGISRLQIDLHLAEHAESDERIETLGRILDRIETLSGDYNTTVHLQMLRARALALLAPTSSIYKSLAGRQFDLLSRRPDIPRLTALKIALQRIRALGPAEPAELDLLAEEIMQGPDVQDFELVLSLACLEHRLGLYGRFEKTVRASPQIEDFVGRLILRDLDYRREHSRLEVSKISPFQVDLAAQAAWDGRPKDHLALLERLCASARFRSPLVLYVTALALRETSPVDAVGLLIEAAESQKRSPNTRLPLKAAAIAQQAVRLACQAYSASQPRSRMLLDTFQRYRRITAAPPPEDLEYCHAGALLDAGQKQEAIELLRKMAASPVPDIRSRATLKLVKLRIADESPIEPGPLEDEIARELLELLQGSTGPTRREALLVYCRFLLDSNDIADAQAVNRLLTDREIHNAPRLALFKARALRCLGRLAESARYLAGISQTEDADYAAEAGALLSQLVLRAEQLQNDLPPPVFSELIENCRTIARRCERAPISTKGLIPAGLLGLYLAEISLLAGSNDPQKLARIEQSLDGLPRHGSASLDLLRCQARMLAAQGSFVAAARAWAELARILKNTPDPNKKRSWRWWRAKFYEIYCFSMIPQTDSRDVLHTIEVLQNSFADIPPLWAERLDRLKHQCSDDDDIAPDPW